MFEVLLGNPNLGMLREKICNGNNTSLKTFPHMNPMNLHQKCALQMKERGIKNVEDINRKAFVKTITFPFYPCNKLLPCLLNVLLIIKDLSILTKIKDKTNDGNSILAHAFWLRGKQEEIKWYINIFEDSKPLRDRTTYFTHREIPYHFQ